MGIVIAPLYIMLIINSGLNGWTLPFGLTSLTDLLTLMHQQQWYPAKEVDIPTPTADLYMRACGPHIPAEKFCLPPNDVACLVSRPIVRQWVPDMSTETFSTIEHDIGNMWLNVCDEDC